MLFTRPKERIIPNGVLVADEPAGNDAVWSNHTNIIHPGPEIVQRL